MANHIKPEAVEFCGACGVILPIIEERTLDKRSPEPNEVENLEDLIYQCDNCNAPSDKVKSITGYFNPEEAARLRSL